MKIAAFLSQSPTVKILSAARQLEHTLNERLEPHQLNILQALILVSLFFEGQEGVRPGTLQQTFQTTKGNISHCLSHLESLGLLKRSNESKDRRACLIKLTRKGQVTCQSLVGLFDGLQTRSEQSVNHMSRFICDLEEIVRVHG